MAYTKPLPVPDETTEGFWRAAKGHQLAIQRCMHCAHFSHPPAVVCPRCLSPAPSFRFEPVSGEGVIQSWTIMRDSFIPAFREDVPWVVVNVELREQPGLCLISRLIDGADASLELGAQVEVVYQDLTPEVTLPMFRMKDKSR